MIIAQESVHALMPNQTLTKIHAEPMHKAVRKLEKELGATLIADGAKERVISANSKTPPPF